MACDHRKFIVKKIPEGNAMNNMSGNNFGINKKELEIAKRNKLTIIERKQMRDFLDQLDEERSKR